MTDTNVMTCEAVELGMTLLGLSLSDWIITAGVLTALIIGVGNWIRDARIRTKEKQETAKAFAILIAFDMLTVNRQGRDAREFLEEARFGPNEGDDGEPINVFENPFSSAIYPLFLIDEPPSLQGSATWARYLPSETIKTICSTIKAVRGWNEKVALLKVRPLRQLLPAQLSDDLVFTLERIVSQSAEAMQRLDEIAGALPWWRRLLRFNTNDPTS